MTALGCNDGVGSALSWQAFSSSVGASYVEMGKRFMRAMNGGVLNATLWDIQMQQDSAPSNRDKWMTVNGILITDERVCVSTLRVDARPNRLPAFTERESYVLRTP